MYQIFPPKSSFFYKLHIIRLLLQFLLSHYIVPSLSRQSIILSIFDIIIKNVKVTLQDSILRRTHMQPKISKFTLRIDSDVLKKFRYVAEYKARSANRELETLMKKDIAEYENEHGKIELE